MRWVPASLMLPLVLGCTHDHPGHPPPPGPDGSIHLETGDGSVRIGAQFSECPSVVVTAGPATTRVGGKVSVTARAVSPDPAARLTYRWTATAGSFTDPGAPDTVYVCPGVGGAGPATLTLLVADGTCAVTRTVTVICFGFADAGAGASDAPATGGAGGQVQSDGGSAGVGGGPGGTGVGGAGDARGAGGAGGAGETCVGDPSACEGDRCSQCTVRECDPKTAGCALLAADADRVRCWALYACIRDSGCIVNGDPSGCWCGGRDSNDWDRCFSGSLPARGPCLQQTIDAARTSDQPTIYQRSIDPNFASGPAFNLAICRASYCGTESSAANPACPLW